MIDWNSLNWRHERAASEFAYSAMDDLAHLRPHLLRDLGWAGVELFQRCLMAAWLSREARGKELPA